MLTNNVQEQKTLPKPNNEIDLQALTTFPHISSDYMSDRVRNKFRDFTLDDAGEVRVARDYWANMELFTQDFRLGNLNKDESYYVRYHIDLCSDILTCMPKSFSKSALLFLERSVSVIETSQSKGGFLRRMFNTLFQNVSTKGDSVPKRNFFGLGKKNKME